MEDASQDAPLAGAKRPREDAAEGTVAGAEPAGGEGEATAAAPASKLHPLLSSLQHNVLLLEHLRRPSAEGSCGAGQATSPGLRRQRRQESRS